MSGSTVRVGLAALLVGVLAGCSSTVAGLAIKAPDSTDSDGATVALMNTGPYDTAAGHPFGTAGNNRFTQSVLESQRLAEFTVGPWQVDAAIRSRGDVLTTVVTGPQPDAETLKRDGVLAAAVTDVAGARSMVAAFSSLRFTGRGVAQQRSLQNVVIRFPAVGDQHLQLRDGGVSDFELAGKR